MKRLILLFPVLFLFFTYTVFASGSVSYDSTIDGYRWEGNGDYSYFTVDFWYDAEMAGDPVFSLQDDSLSALLGCNGYYQFTFFDVMDNNLGSEVYHTTEVVSQDETCFPTDSGSGSGSDLSDVHDQILDTLQSNGVKLDNITIILNNIFNEINVTSETDVVPPADPVLDDRANYEPSQPTESFTDDTTYFTDQGHVPSPDPLPTSFEPDMWEGVEVPPVLNADDELVQDDSLVKDTEMISDPELSKSGELDKDPSFTKDTVLTKDPVLSKDHLSTDPVLSSDPSPSLNPEFTQNNQYQRTNFFQQDPLPDLQSPTSQ